MKPLKSTVRTRLYSLINAARIKAVHPNSVSSVKHSMMSDRSMKRILGDIEVRNQIVARGIEMAIRGYLKEEPNGDIETAGDEQQFEMWADEMRVLVKDIDKARLFVPSRGDRGEFVSLIPGEISKAEVKEAGEALVKKGEDTVRRGRNCIALADLME